MLKIIPTKQFSRDYKKLVKSGKTIEKLDDAIKLLANNEKLPAKYRDHPLKGNYIGYRECHIEPDWLLIYKINEKKLYLHLARTGSHANLFE